MLFVEFRTWRWTVQIIRLRIYQDLQQLVMEKPQIVMEKVFWTPVYTLEMQPLTQEELDLSFILRYVFIYEYLRIIF